LLEAAARLRPDVAVVDIAMPLLNGLDAARLLKQSHPDIRIIFLTMNEDPDLAAEAFRAGASGYLLKRSAASELMTAIREVMKRRSYVTPLVTEGMVGLLTENREPATHTTDDTPARSAAAEGCSMKEIANILNITSRTVAFHSLLISGAISHQDDGGADPVRDQESIV
jgi:DNA-binding NarL/FixJ family response regulator